MFYPGSGALDVDRAVFVGKMVKEAERVVTIGGLPYVLPEGYQMLLEFQANDLVTDADITSNDAAIIPTIYLPFGYVARSIDPVNEAIDVIVAIRGTETVWEWIQDAQFLMKQFPYVDGAGNTEDGFTNMYSSLSVTTPAGGHTRLIDAIAAAIGPLGEVTITVTGHSLGSAIATLLGIDIAGRAGLPNPTVITFASPYVGNAAFVAKYNALVPNSFRVANVVDVVTHLPGSLLGFYKHVDTLVQMNFFGKVLTGVVCFHAMESYLHFLSLETPNAMTLPLDPGCVATLPLGL